jgi:type I restriction enzyme R subunit
MVREAIEAFRQERIDEAEYLSRVEDLEQQAEQGAANSMPTRLQGRPAARAYYGVIRERVTENRDLAENGAAADGSDLDREELAEAGIEIEEIIKELKVVDWKRNPDVEKKMRNEIEDYLYFELGFSLHAIEPILDDVIRIARSRS